MIKNIEFENGLYGKRAIIKGKWEDDFVKCFFENNVQELELNDGKGWCGENIDFLKFLPNIKSLKILDFKLKSIEGINYLKGLVHLHLSTYCKNPVDFNFFPNLIDCNFEWIKGSESLFNCKNLKKLAINRFDGKSTQLFSKLIDLENLTILNSKIENVEGIKNLINLEYLSFTNLKNLLNLQGIQNLVSLKVLELQKCKGICSIDEVFKLHGLERLLLLDLGDISSISGIQNLYHLEEFYFYESTNIIDGNLMPIKELKNLKKISFQNRKHYNIKREDFGKLYR